MIRCETATPVVMPGGKLNAASLIAWAVVERGINTPASYAPEVIDIPWLQCLWRDAHGKPLWAATDFYPVGDSCASVEYVHKRHPVDRADFGRKLKINTAAGQYKERRKPVRTLSPTGGWIAAVLVNDDAAIDVLRDLIGGVVSLGAMGAHGFGRVVKWDASTADIDVETILAHRSIPVASGMAPDGRGVSLCPWTPPYWHAPWWSDCVEGQQCFSAA